MVVTRRDHQARERLRRGSGGRLGAEATLARTTGSGSSYHSVQMEHGNSWPYPANLSRPPTPSLREGTSPETLRRSGVLSGSETVVQTGGRRKRVHVRPGSLAPRHTVVPWTSGKKIPTLLVMVKYFRIVWNQSIHFPRWNICATDIMDVFTYERLPPPPNLKVSFFI